MSAAGGHDLKIGAIVLNYRRWPQVRQTVEALLAQSLPPEKTIIIDNCSGDGSAGFLRQAFPELEIIETERNFGYAAGMNLGIRRLMELKPDAVLLLTHECKLDRPALELLAGRLAGDDGIGAVGPLIGHLDNPEKVYSAGGFMGPTWKPTHLKKPSSVAWWKQQPAREVEWIDGACWLIRPQVIEDIGLLDERYFLYFEESSYCLAMRRAGWRTELVPAAVAWQEPVSIPPYLWTRNFLGFVAETGPRRFLALHLAFEAVTAAASLFPSRKPGAAFRRKEHRRGLQDFLLQRWGPPGQSPAPADVPARLPANAAPRDRFIAFLTTAKRTLKKLTQSETDKRAIQDDVNLRLLLAFALSEDSNCIDVGANVGSFLAEVVRVAPKGRHIAYEPLPYLARDLAVRFPQVDVRDRALSDSQGRRQFVHVPALHSHSGFIERTYPSPQQTEIIEVQTEDLDSSLPEGFHPRLIKIDVEGAEGEVLRGASKTIAKYRPIVVFEHGPGASDLYGTKPEDIFGLFSGHGLRIFDLDGNGPYDLDGFVAEYWRGKRWQYVAHT